LPPVCCRPRNNVLEHRDAGSVAMDTTPLRAALAALQPIEFRQVRGTEHEPLFGALLAAHHYPRILSTLATSEISC
jgi:hypothetical protein